MQPNNHLTEASRAGCSGKASGASDPGVEDHRRANGLGDLRRFGHVKDEAKLMEQGNPPYGASSVGGATGISDAAADATASGDALVARGKTGLHGYSGETELGEPNI